METTNDFIGWLIKRITTTETERNESIEFNIAISKGGKLTAYKEVMEYYKSHNESCETYSKADLEKAFNDGYNLGSGEHVEIPYFDSDIDPNLTYFDIWYNDTYKNEVLI